MSKSSKRRLTAEQRTVNLKEELFSEHLPITDDLLESLRVAGVDIELSADAFNKNVTNKDRVKQLLAALHDNWSQDYFDKICDVLDTVNPWLSDELRFELQGEKGTQQVSEALQLENSRIVFKEFGHEKRLSELEKKRLLKLLNRKTQTTRDIWENQLNRLNNRLEEATRHSNTIDEEATRLAREVEEFIATNAAEHFKNRAVVSAARTTTDLFHNLPALQQLEIQMNCLIQLSGQSILETDNINDEKRKVAKRIELEQLPEKEGIDVKLKEHLEEKKRRIAECKQAITVQQKLAEKLRDEVRRADLDREQQLAAKQRSIDEITQRAIAKDDENNELEKAIEKLQQELAEIHQQLVHYSSRSFHLERGKRLQNLFETVTEVKESNNKPKSSYKSLPKIAETTTSDKKPRAISSTGSTSTSTISSRSSSKMK